MPVKELIAHELIADGAFCTLGVVVRRVVLIWLHLTQKTAKP